MAPEEIERLKEKIAKDPNSKLFVPLAEEYKKSGMISEAIDVLTQGLDRQPGYLSARVSLGKIFMEKSMLDEAKAEFEKVIAAIPDNLYAHKKLAEIYRDLGEKDKSIKAYKTVLALNPMDESASASLSELQDRSENPSSDLSPEPPKAVFEATAHSGESAGDDEEFDIEVSGGKAEEGASEVFPETPPEFAEAGELSRDLNIPEEDIELWKSSTTSVEEDIPAEEPPGVSISEEDLALWKAQSESLHEDNATSSIESADISEEASSSFESIMGQPAEDDKQPLVAGEISPRAESFEEADRYILKADYAGAMNVYRKLLSTDPGDIQVIQRTEELKTLLKLLGKDKEELIEKLEEFLGALKKRRNELFGSP
jgi:tetratricopeptide (TPR) repeat protein